MKKIFLLILGFIISVSSVSAKNLRVEAMSDLSTANPPKTWKVKIVDGFIAQDGFVVYAGSVLEGRIESISEPKRLKRNAAFVFVPTKYYDAGDNTCRTVTEKIEGKYSSMTDVTVGSVAKTGAIMVGDKVISGFFGSGVALVQGAVKNEQGNRAKSAAVSVYENSPLSYINKGKELEIQKGQVFVMSFKQIKDEEEDKPNYEYTTSAD